MQDLAFVCVGLGEAEQGGNGIVGYSRGEYCLDNLKDLLRFLRRDDPEKREAFKQVCKLKTVSNHLIPIIEHCQDDRDLVLNAVKVLVFLTMPIEPASSDIVQQIEYLWQLKSSITSSDIVAVIISLLESPLENLESEQFTEDDWKLLQLVLTLFRNLLAIQDISPHQKAAGSAAEILYLRDKFMELLFREHVIDLILVATQNVGDDYGYLRQDNLLLLEIYLYMFTGQDPELVAKANLDNKDEGEAKSCLTDLKSIMEKERDKRRSSRLNITGRHSQFSGTFARLTMDGAKAIFKGNPPGSHDSLLKSDQGPRKKLVSDEGGVQLMNSNILELLHGFLKQFLSGGYNVLMHSVREDVEKEHPTVQKSDILNFVKVAKFVISFQYHRSSISKPDTETNSTAFCSGKDDDSTLFNGNFCGPIASSMNESMLFLVISRWRDAFESLKETKDYRFLSAAGSLLKAMIKMLDLVLTLQPENARESRTARVLLYKLFYDQTDQGMTQFLLNLIRSFNAQKQPRSDLADLIEVAYVIIRLMERLQDQGTLRVSKKSRMGRKKKASADKMEKETNPEANTNQAAIQKESAMPDAEQSANNHGDIPLSNLNGEEGTSILPEADIPKEPVPELEIEVENPQQARTDVLNDLSDNATDSSGDEQVAYNEVDFKVSTLLSAIANNGIIHSLCWLLKFYKSNSAATNHHIISILRRISDDLELSPMLYQLSFLAIFYEILAEQKSHPCKEFTTLEEFLVRLVRKFLKKLKHQPLLFVELLFSKTRRECHYINVENLLHEVGNLRKQTGKIGNNGETGAAHNTTGWARRSIADALGDDEADVVISHDFEHHMNDINSAEASETVSNIDIVAEEGFERSSTGHETGKSKRKRRLVLNGEMETKIMDLYEKFKDDQGCSHLIAEALDADGNVLSAQVVNKLKELGLKVPRKKRTRCDDGNSSKPDLPAEEGKAGETTDPVQSLRRQPLHTKKRVCALTEDQEATIRTLFKKFKDHKRCSYMIAKALDGDRLFTAAQITRILKKLSLRQEKSDKGGGRPRNKTLSNSSEDEMQVSDSETLSSMRFRSKNAEKSHYKGLRKLNILEDLSESDEEPLSSMLKSKNKGKSHVKGSQNLNILEDLSESDEEPLSSMLKRKNKKIKSLDKQSTDITDEGKSSGDESDEEPLSSVLQKSRKLFAKSNKNDASTRSSAEEMQLDEGPHDEIMIMENPEESDEQKDPPNYKVESDDPRQQLEDELADSGDDIAADVEPVSSSRRKLRIVLDLDDDDE